MQPQTLQIDGPSVSAENSAAVEAILRALPDWFGIEEAVRQYRDDAAELPTIVARINGGPAGCLTIRQHTPYAAEIWVMGVLPEYHRRGIGTAMARRAEEWLRARGVEYLQVKTLAAAHPDPGYAQTRAFYERAGFRPLEVFPSLWNEENPCLLLVKKLG